MGCSFAGQWAQKQGQNVDHTHAGVWIDRFLTACIYTLSHICMRMHIHSCMHTYTYRHITKCTSHTHTQQNTHTHTHTHTLWKHNRHAHIHPMKTQHTHTHTYTYYENTVHIHMHTRTHTSTPQHKACHWPWTRRPQGNFGKNWLSRCLSLAASSLSGRSGMERQ